MRLPPIFGSAVSSDSRTATGFARRRRTWRLRWTGVMVTLAASASHLAAQPRPVTLAEFGEMASAVVRAVLPQGTAVAGVNVEQRGVIVDFRQSLPTFGLDAETPHAGLITVRDVEDAPPGALAGCSGTVPQPCTTLGDRVYLRLRLDALRDSTASVFTYVHAATSLAVRATSAQGGSRFLTGFVQEVILRRGADGTWRFDHLGKTVVG